MKKHSSTKLHSVSDGFYTEEDEITVEYTERNGGVVVDSTFYTNLVKDKELIECEMKTYMYRKNGLEVLTPEDIQIEFVSDIKASELSTSNLLYCDECNEQYEEYCLKCPMLVRILHNTISEITKNGTRQTLPRNILEIKEISGHYGVFAMKCLPNDVVFGPFDGVLIAKNWTEHGWKIENGRLLSVKNATEGNWMQCVNSVEEVSLGNLVIFQYKDKLFYRTCKEINAGEELLVWYDKDCITTFNNGNHKEYYQPIAEIEVENTYACTFCCLGFNLEWYLLKHKTKCPNAPLKTEDTEEIVQCSFCEIYLLKSEYQNRHMVDCGPKSAKKPATHISDSQEERSTATKFIPSKSNVSDFREAFPSFNWSRATSQSCQQRKYPNSGEDLETGKQQNDVISNSHALQEMRPAKLVKKDLTGGSDEKYKDARCELETEHRSIKNSFLTQGVAKPCESKICNERLLSRDRRKIHAKAKHCDVTESVMNSPVCQIQTSYKTSSKRNRDYSHSDGFGKNFKCTVCPYQTDNKSDARRHLYTHTDLELFPCKICNRGYTRMEYLNRHVRDEHAGEDRKEFECSKCPFQINYKHNLKAHLYTHEDVTPFQCEICNVGFTTKHMHEMHTRNKHSGVQEKEYKCTTCKYKTNYKSGLRRHLRVHDIKEFKCDFCEKWFKRKSYMMLHMKRLHFAAEKYNC